MNRAITMATLCLMATMNLAVAQAHKKHAARDSGGATEVATRFADAINRKDASAAASLYTEDATLMPPNAAAIKGRAAIESYWKQGIEQGVSDLVITPVETSSSGNIGYEALNFELSAGSSDKKVREKGKSVVVLKRGTDGQWRIAYDIWNDDTAPGGQ
jgi:uncharacterized protein (TIGR02246 family)